MVRLLPDRRVASVRIVEGACLSTLVIGLVGCLMNATPKAVPPVAAPAAAGAVQTVEDSVSPSNPAAESASATGTLEGPSADGHNRLDPEEIAAGWIRLFDGQSLFGWKANSATKWTVAEGVIAAEDGPEKGLLVSTTRWADYELRCDVHVATGGNSGIFLRTPFEPKNPATDCYELNACDSHSQFKTASLVGRAVPTATVAGDGDWHRYHVIVRGPKVTVRFDDQLVLEYTDETASPLKSGFIGLQMNGGHVRFRNVFLKPLGLEDWFDGKSLEGWRVVPGSVGEVQPEADTIRITGGRGFLESERTAADFVLQFQAITHGDALNSGVFFRTEAGTVTAPSNGYEFQIQSGFKNGDRDQPADFGTGAIFRRIAARRVISNDREWFTATLVADGPRFTTWVNGVAVVDWTDERPEKPNPREGLRKAAGHFSLQGHDPTTNLQFRQFRVAPLP